MNLIIILIFQINLITFIKLILRFLRNNQNDWE